MAKLTTAGSYLFDYSPTEPVNKDLTEAQVRETVQKYLKIDSFEPFDDQQLIMNKTFVNLGGPDEKGMVLALYNHDGVYSVWRYKKR